MVKKVGDWHWSSYHAMINAITALQWPEAHWLLACFSKQ